MARQRKAWISRHRFPLLNGLFWVLVGLDTYASTLSWSILPITQRYATHLAILFVVGGLVFCSGMHRRFNRNQHWQKLRGWRRAFALIGSSFLFVFSYALIIRILCLVLGVPAYDYTPLQIIAKDWVGIGGLQLRILVWSGLYLLVLSARDQQQLERQHTQQEKILIQAQLRFLTSAFQPHFLMNGLNAILACKDNPEEVENGVIALSEYLRYTLEKPDSLEPLQQQLDALENYISVQELRFGSRFSFDLTVDRNTLSLLVPRFLLQPLVENACKHGSFDRNGKLSVEVQCRRSEAELILSVCNSGQWRGAREGGYGLSALRQQLELFYGAAAALFVSDNDTSAIVTMKLPMREQVMAHA